SVSLSCSSSVSFTCSRQLIGTYNYSAAADAHSTSFSQTSTRSFPCSRSFARAISDAYSQSIAKGVRLQASLPPRRSIARRSTLVLGYWSFFGAWNLGFGAFLLIPAARPAPVFPARANASAALIHPH